MIGAFIFLLISGIVSSAIGDNETLSPSEMVPRHVHFFGYVNTTFADIEKFDIELCEKNGGSKAFEEHKRSREEYDTCLSAVFMQVEQDPEANDYSTSPNYNVDNYYYQKYCRRIPKFENCLKNFTDSMKTCLDPTKHESADIVYNTVSSLARFLCEDNGDRIIKFEAADGDECLQSKSSGILRCFNETVGKYVQSAITDGAAIGGLGKYHLLIPDVNKCSHLEKFQVCMVEELKNCAHPMPADLTDSLFNVLKKVTTCDHLLKSQASPIGVANVLLMTTVTAMSLQFTRT